MPSTIAAAIALALLAIFGLLGFGWRAWLQRRRTGSYGFHGVSGRVGSVEWMAGVGFVVAVVVAGLGPLLQLFAVVTPWKAPHEEWMQAVGIAVATAGLGLTVWAQLQMGDSWRVGVDTEETTPLVHTGVFGLVRNPIYSAMLVFEFGIALLTPNPVTVGGFLLALGSLELQVRRVEESHLLTKHGALTRTTPPGWGGLSPASDCCADTRGARPCFRRPGRCHRPVDAHRSCAWPRAPRQRRICESATRCPSA
jgi:protein-S-isoprenylcysteine O-methyltransferase Ste14